MSAPQLQPANGPAPATDSPWFWATLFCAFGIGLLLLVIPKYQGRQRELEMEYQARKEIVRRQAEGEPLAREAGQEGTVAPPVLGELIIPLWPLLTLFFVLLIVSFAMLQRAMRRDRAAFEAARLGGKSSGRGEP